MRHTPKLADETHVMKVIELYCSVFRTVVTEDTEYAERRQPAIRIIFRVFRVFCGFYSDFSNFC